MVDDYRIQYAYFADSKNPEFKASWNQIVNVPRVSMPADTAIQTANSDTPYSFVGIDLRAEPIVLTVPPIDAEWSIYVGSALIQDSVWRCAWQALAP